MRRTNNNKPVATPLSVKNFENWKAEELELAYGLREVKHHTLLDTWLGHHAKPNLLERETLKNLQEVLQENVDSWNEDEVKFFFIGPLVSLVNFRGEHFRSFTQRPLNAHVMGMDGKMTDLSGKVDMMVASGKEDPRNPFFFVHEYKPEKRRDTDPKGQLLASMLAAQKKNGRAFPILGSYVIGRLWFFMVLEGDVYARSLAYDASREGLYEVFSFLKFAKKHIEKYANALATQPPTQ